MTIHEITFYQLFSIYVIKHIKNMFRVWLCMAFGKKLFHFKFIFKHNNYKDYIYKSILKRLKYITKLRVLNGNEENLKYVFVKHYIGVYFQYYSTVLALLKTNNCIKSTNPRVLKYWYNWMILLWYVICACSAFNLLILLLNIHIIFKHHLTICSL